MRHARGNNTPWWRRLMRSRYMIAIDLLAVGFVGWSLANEVAQGNKVSSELNDLQAKIAAAQKQNTDYGDILSKLGSPGFVDKEARLKLGYQKPGEQVMLLEDASAPALAPVSADDVDASGLSDPQKWWRYFFGG